MKYSGIYRINSKIKSNKFYIGSAVDISKRWRDHLNTLRLNKHANIKLQRHYNKYGECDIQFSILLLCDKEDLIKIEQYFIDFYKPIFNICKIAGSGLGTKRSIESRKKMIGRPVSQETRKRISEGLKGNKNSLGSIHTEEYKKMMSDLHKGSKNHMYGKHLSNETKEKMSNTVKNKNRHN